MAAMLALERILMLMDSSPNLFKRHSDLWIPSAVAVSMSALIGLGFWWGSGIALAINCLSLLFLFLARLLLRQLPNSVLVQSFNDSFGSLFVSMNNILFQLFFWGVSGFYGRTGMVMLSVSFFLMAGFSIGLYSFWKREEMRQIAKLLSGTTRMSVSSFANRIVPMSADGSWFWASVDSFFPFLPLLFRRFILPLMFFVSFAQVFIFWKISGRVDWYVLFYWLISFNSLPKALFWATRVLYSYRFMERCGIGKAVRSNDEVELVSSEDSKFGLKAMIL